MTAARRFTPAEIFVSILTGFSGLLAIVVLALWAHSFHRADTLHIPGPGAGSFQLISDEGRLMVGLFPEDTPGTRVWGRRMTAQLSDLQMERDRFFLLDFWGWGVSIPHLVWAAAFAIPPIWWIIVVRDRRELQLRLRGGLCRVCGYDLRYSENRCPECGTEINVAGTIMSNATSDAALEPALPPPPLST